MKSPVFLIAEFVLVLAILVGAGVYSYAFPGESRRDGPALVLTSMNFWGGDRIGASFVLYADGTVLFSLRGKRTAMWMQTQLNTDARDELLSAAHKALTPTRNCFSVLPAIDGPAINIFLHYRGQIVIGGFRGVARNPPSVEDCKQVEQLRRRLSEFDAAKAVPATRLGVDGRPSGEAEWNRAIRAAWPDSYTSMVTE